MAGTGGWSLPSPAMHAVILAGGKGTRLRPLTDTRPKPLVPFMAAPFAAGLLRRLQQAGCNRATFLVGPTEAPFTPLRDLGRDLGLRIGLVPEETPLDTAGAARRLLRHLGETEPVLVCNGDILTDLNYAELVRVHRQAEAAATLALTRVEDTSAFGVVVCNDRGVVERFVEKPPAGTETAETVNAGTYVLSPDVFDAFPGDGPLSFERVVFPGLLASGQTVLGHPSPGFWADLGTPQRYLEGHRAVLDGRCDWPTPPGLRRGDGTAALHETARVEPGASLSGTVVVGANCVIGRDALLHDAVLFDDVQIGARASVSSAVLGEGVRVAEDAVVDGAVHGDGAVVAAAPSTD